jgi:hypothetical protein
LYSHELLRTRRTPSEVRAQPPRDGDGVDRYSYALWSASDIARTSARVQRRAGVHDALAPHRFAPVVPLMRPTPTPPGALLTFHPALQAQAYWARADAEIAAAVAANPCTVWVRQHWMPVPGEASCDGRATLILRYRPAFPPQLAGYMSREEWSSWLAQLDEADSGRTSCIGRGAALTVFVLLFYTTVLGIFPYMCAEYSMNRKRVRRAVAAKAEVIAAWAEAMAARGVHVAGRWNPRLPQADDGPVDGNGRAINDVPYICITLPRAPTAWTAGAPPQQYHYAHTQQYDGPAPAAQHGAPEALHWQGASPAYPSAPTSTTAGGYLVYPPQYAQHAPAPLPAATGSVGATAAGTGHGTGVAKDAGQLLPRPAVVVTDNPAGAAAAWPQSVGQPLHARQPELTTTNPGAMRMAAVALDPRDSDDPV